MGPRALTILPTLRELEVAVLALGALAVGLAIVVYLLMETRHRRQIRRDARRLILRSKLFPPLAADALRDVWKRSGRGDKELIEEVLVGMCASAADELKATIERSVVGSGIFDRWISDVRNGGPSTRVRAATRLGYVHDLRGVFELARATGDGSLEVRMAAVLGLGRLQDPRGLLALVTIASKPSSEIPDFTLAAALAGCAQKSPGGLANLLRARETRARVIGTWALSEVADRTVLRYLLAAARDPEPEVRAKVARALARIDHPQSIEALHRMAGDPIWFVRVRALDALGKLQARSEEETALASLGDKVREVRYRAATALRQVGGTRGDLVAKALAARSRLSFDSLISEWDREGFLWLLVAGLSTRDFPSFLQSRETLKLLIGAGVVRALTHLILVYPDVKLRLRLLRLFLEVSSPSTQEELIALADGPRCDRRVAAAIKRILTGPDARRSAGVNPSPA